MTDHKYKFWIHGVNVHVQNESATASIKRYSQGTKIRQNAGGNWFHLAIPTPTLLNDHEVEQVDAFLRGKINGQATIKNVHIWRGGEPRDHRVLAKDYPDGQGLSNRILDELYNLPDEACHDPLVMCIYVDFENGGEIFFAGAGARFDEKA